MKEVNSLIVSKEKERERELGRVVVNEDRGNGSCGLATFEENLVCVGRFFSF